MITRSVRVDAYLWKLAVEKAGFYGNLNSIIGQLLTKWVKGEIEL